MPLLPLSSSVMVSNVSFSSAVARELTAGLRGYRWINEDAGGIKEEMSQLPSGDNTAENQKTICSPVCSSLWDNCSSKERCRTGCKTDLWYNYTNKRQASTLSRTHEQAFKRSRWVANKKKSLSSVSMVTEQSRPTYSFSLVSQHYSFRKLSKLVWGFVFLTMSECIYLWNGKRKANIFFAKQSQWKRVTIWIIGDKRRHTELGWTLRSAAYCLHVLWLALQLLSVAFVQCVVIV